MFKRVSYPVIVVLTLILALCVQAHGADFEAIDELIETKNVSRIREAIDRLETHLKGNSQDGEALWRTAKAYLYLGDRVDDDKLEVFETGKAYAETAVEFLPTSPHPHFWQAALTGRIGQTRGILSSLFMVRPMKDALDQALELDENYADAHWALSQLYHQAPGFPLSIGSKKSALQHAERAIELDPGNLDYQLQLALALEYNGRKDEAISVLESLLVDPALNQEPELRAEAEAYHLDFTK